MSAGDQFDDNPFADPIPKITPSIIGSNVSNTDLTATVTTPANVPDIGAAVLDTTNPQPPAYTPSQQTTMTAEEFKRRQEDLDRRAQELDRREQELRNANFTGPRPNNWPPVPEFLGIQPCFFMDISIDIPVEFQKIVRTLYHLWIGHVFLLLSNMIVGMLYLFVGGDSGQMFGLSLFYLAIFAPASFLCWFRPAYKAFRDDSSLNFILFFFVFFFQFIVAAFSALGIGDTGSCGLITAIGQFNGADGPGGVFVGLLMILTALGFAVLAVGDLYMLLKVHKIYKASGASVAKAQAEFSTGVANSEGVKQAATQAAKSQFTSFFSSSSSRSANASGGSGPSVSNADQSNKF